MPDNTTTAKPGKLIRRWFQFRLRTLLVVVTVSGSACAGYLAHEAKIVRERKAWIDAHPGAYRFAEDKLFSFGGKSEEDLPLIRRWMGDKPLDTIIVNDKDDSAETLFPEADAKMNAP